VGAIRDRKHVVLRVGKNTKRAVLSKNLAFLTYHISCLDPVGLPVN